MPITYQHRRTSRTVQVLTPQERAQNAEMPDRVMRRQKQLIDKMDSSAKWTRVMTPSPLGGPPRTPDPIVTQVPPDTTPTDSDAPSPRVARSEPPHTPEVAAEMAAVDDLSDPGKDAAAPTEPGDDLPQGPTFTRVVKKNGS